MTKSKDMTNSSGTDLEKRAQHRRHPERRAQSILDRRTVPPEGLHRGECSACKSYFSDAISTGSTKKDPPDGSSALAAITDPSLRILFNNISTGAGVEDYDNDGDLDLVTTTGLVENHFNVAPDQVVLMMLHRGRGTRMIWSPMNEPMKTSSPTSSATLAAPRPSLSFVHSSPTGSSR